MTQDEKQKLIQHILAMPSTEVAKKLADDSSVTLGRLILQANKTRKTEREIRRLGLWGRD